MKKLFIYLLVLGTLSSCFEEDGRTILYEDEFLELDAATTVTGSRLFTYLRVNDGAPVPSTFVVNLAAAQRGSATNFSFEIDVENSTAIENLHYVVNSTTGSIPANSSTAMLPIDILDDNIEAGERLSIVVRLTSGDVEINPNYTTATHEIEVTCPLDGLYLGDYALDNTGIAQPFGAATFGPDGKVVTLVEVPGSTSKRAFSFIYLETGAFGNGEVQLVFDMNCGNVVVDNTGPLGLSCVEAPITIDKIDGDVPYDDDDSELIITFLEFVEDGDCGLDPITQVIRLVKQ